MTSTVTYQSFEMDMTADTTDDEIRRFVEDGNPGFEQIDEYAISERAFRLSQERGFVTSSNQTLTDADEIEAYLLDLARQQVQDGIDETVAGLIRARDEMFA